MSTKPSRSQHLKLEPPDTASVKPPSSLVAAKLIDVQRIAYDHAICAGRTPADAADASQDIALRFLPQLEADAEFLRDEKVRTNYTKAAVTNWFKDQWRRGKLHEKSEDWIAALIVLHRNDGAEDPTPEELLAIEEVEAAKRTALLIRVRESIAALPRETRKVFEDRHVKQLDVATVAKKRHKSEGTIRVQTHHALIAIRQALGVEVKESRRPEPPGITSGNKPELMP